MPSNFPIRGLTEADKYLLAQAAAQGRTSQNQWALTALRAALDAALPGARDAYERRDELAEKLMHRLGIDPESPEFARNQTEARALLARADQLRQDKTA
ncbi:hypothetical protein JK358_35880 [Nocardia sp. 2]|uniref:Uncharacterized protein n=1 Tax=Nocardia acididurans TaxID=2802282 RepID=A0ABS1MGX3_9NOCA|nr:hypothetical protein [Nocardia acididurans]MBL1079796.1 hypothetical protein [Nocardia acididurans]